MVPITHAQDAQSANQGQQQSEGMASAFSQSPDLPPSSPLQAKANGSPQVKALRSLQDKANASPQVQAAAQLKAFGQTGQGRQSFRPPSLQLKASPLPDSSKPIQRQIKGLEHYSNANNITDDWIEAYYEDIGTSNAHLTHRQVMYLYKKVRGKTPDEENVTITNPGVHWDLTYKEINYRTKADGNCGIHVVALADSLLKGNEPSPLIAFEASIHNVQQSRQMLMQYLINDEDETAHGSKASAQTNISHTIRTVEQLFDTGFGPKLTMKLKAARVLSNGPDRRKFVHAGYCSFRKKYAMGDTLPKPSVFLQILDKNGFWDANQDTDDLGDLLGTAIEVAEEKHVSFNLRQINFDKRKDQDKVLMSSVDSILGDFRTTEEIEAELAEIPSALSHKRAADKILMSGRYLTKDQATNLKNKLDSPSFVRKVMNASQGAVNSFKKSGVGVDPYSLAAKGTTDFSSKAMSDGQLIGAFSGFRDSDSIMNNDLKVGTGDGNVTSIGDGGMQVKGLGTYDDEITWFKDKVKLWNAKPTDLIQAMVSRDDKSLQQLVKNEKDKSEYNRSIKHLKSFHVLHVLEIFRGGPFGIGVKAHEDLGFHGKTDLTAYMRNMPMESTAATTNVTQTGNNFDNPHDPSLWKIQMQSTVDGLKQLADLTVEEEDMWNGRTQAVLLALWKEPDNKNNPTEGFVKAIFEYMQEPEMFNNPKSKAIPHGGPKKEHKPSKPSHKMFKSAKAMKNKMKGKGKSEKEITLSSAGLKSAKGHGAGIVGASVIADTSGIPLLSGNKKKKKKGKKIEKLKKKVLGCVIKDVVDSENDDEMPDI